MEAACSIFGSLILLFYYDVSVVLVCLSILLPVIAVSYLYGKRMKQLNQQKNDELEKQVDIISTGNTHLIKQHYDNLRKWQIRISDQEAWNFGIMEIMVMVVIGLALLITNKTNGASIEAGNLIGIYSYIQRFVSGLDTIPYTVQRLSSLTDITRRIELQEEDLLKPPLKEVA
jgi:ABC-type multidrug transport system fused ATPase/permease subunit